jgi:hypothetical protein
MSGLISKVLAGGLSAGVFLVWWPAHVTATGSEWLFVRGILWSLAFEILLLAYSPLEKAVAGAVRAREPRRLGTPRIARVLTFAALAIAVPLVMLAGARPPVAAPARADAPKVIVKREIVKREVVVRRVNKVVRVPGPTVTTTAPATPSAATPAPARSTRTATTPKKTPSTHAAAGTTPATASTGTQADTKGDTAAPATTSPTPAATKTAAQPTTAAKAPAATTATPAAAEATVAGGR